MSLSRPTSIATPIVTLLVLLILCAPALAAGLEKPEALAPTEVRAETATLQGTLSPKSPGEVGSTYEFVYKASKTGECKGESATPPVESIMGLEAEPVAEPVGALKPETEYAVCLVVHNAAKTEAATSTAVTFKTYLTPEAPETKPADPVAGITATLHGVLDPTKAGEAGSKYEFRYRQSTSECQGESATPAGTATGATSEPVETEIAGLAPGTTYAFCLVAENSGGDEAVVGPTKTFRTLATAPFVAGEEASEIGATTATVKVQITPDGAATSYHAEYVTEAQFEAHEWAEATSVPASAAELPATDSPISVSEHLDGLATATNYVFRFTAKNESGIASSATGTFSTRATLPAGGLPDNRVYELVSPPTEGEPYFPENNSSPEGFTAIIPFRASANGSSVAYSGEPSATSGTGETGSGSGNQWLATRTATGWSAQDITPANNSDAAYESFSPDLSTAFYQGNQTPLTADVEPGCEALYSRMATTGEFHPLYTTSATPHECGHPMFVGATTDASTVIFQSEAALTTNTEPVTVVPPGIENGTHGLNPNLACQLGCNLYEASHGALSAVNIVNGKDVSAVFGGYGGNEAETPNFQDAISEDGAHVFWTDIESGPTVYMLKDGTTNVPISGPEPAEYQGASLDGHYAFYTETGRLWRYDTTTETREALTAENADVLGVVGINTTGEDGSYIYLVANGVLTNIPNGQGASATPGACTHQRVTGEALCNLYLLHDGETDFIGSLSQTDSFLLARKNNDPNSSDWQGGLGERITSVTPDGTHLAFQSVMPLTGYESGFTGEGARAQLFVYSAADRRLACASCNPTGAPLSNNTGEPARESKVPVSATATTYTDHWLSDSGNRVFFDSEQKLTSQDRNGAMDVYEWEGTATPGESNNSCTAALASPTTGGCTFLISGGVGRSPSVLVDADTTGENVFFEHTGALGQVEVPVDHNELYDARVGGGFLQTTVGCSATACPPLGEATSLAAPSSEIFEGTGNLLPIAPTKAAPKPKPKTITLSAALKKCRRDKHKATRRRCERTAKRQHAKSSARRSVPALAHPTIERRTHS